MSTLMSFIIMVIATVLAIFYMVMFTKGNQRYGQMMAVLDDPFKICYSTGSAILEVVHYRYSGKYAQKMMRRCRILYGEKYAEFYFRVNMAQKVSMGLLVLIVGLIFTVLYGEIIILLLAVGAAVGIVYYYETTIMDEIHRREDSISNDFPEVLSKLALLVNAGMIMGEAWNKVAYTGEGVIYQEMQTAVLEMQNGVSEIEAILHFSSRCDVDMVTKFSSTLVQNLSKGNSELVHFLRQFSNESWVEKKQNARRKGEEASSKLLLPIGLMFAGLLIMICVPIFTGISL